MKKELLEKRKIIFQTKKLKNGETKEKVAESPI